MRYLFAYLSAVFLAALLAGCASVTTTAESPEGWLVKQDARAIGKAGIDKVSQGLAGSVDIQQPDGSHVRVELESNAQSENLKSEDVIGELLLNAIMKAAQGASP